MIIQTWHFPMLPLQIMVRNNMYYKPSMLVTILNTLSFNHHKVFREVKVNHKGKLSKFSKTTEIM